ncbi:hypothetical protein A3B84_00390 [Candidatus Nomurabacteria bacterium RIFCSPHIGHO2_02_FULL_35_13]|uniref:Prepilin-type N-terminal cleavage/methylation domain-containing protein n=2 Tax=Candidatus Nomuraibacteriota TaxID=1752729 RepID=A0A1F6VPL5_9BACT|nr:MAG: hypothetical protein UR88_C0009G0006 [Candidatus Nomurabacteria bacterium GW2011_GWA1_35_8]OGI71554.1 MAG: hypothetical protein A3B84_00390 [Candidatus Nomurabacteria bacterium RIFCSPHIGHO2_02_FULL_35_13]
MNKINLQIKRARPAKPWRSRGYTIIETMIAISIFLVVVMIGMGALLNANLIQQKSQNMRSIMDNLSFIMEDMSRNLRTGSAYVSSSVSEISFETATGEQWAYKIESGNIDKSTDGGTIWVNLNPVGEIIIDETVSGFSVIGAEPPPPGDSQQPFVTIRLVGNITYKDIVTPFSLQTSVSQRLLDR